MMKHFKTIALILSILLFSSILPQKVMAQEVYNGTDINKRIEAELTEFVNANNIKVSLENFNFTINQKYVNSPNLEELLEKEIDNMKAQLLSIRNELNKPAIQPFLSFDGSRYTAEIWAGVPAGGWSTVKQDFFASVANGKVYSISFSGDSYMTGVAWGQYSHIDSWYSIYSNNTKVDIYIKGLLNYTWEIIGGGYAATFLEELEVSGNQLVRQW